jgi:hypothetical protein
MSGRAQSDIMRDNIESLDAFAAGQLRRKLHAPQGNAVR